MSKLLDKQNLPEWFSYPDEFKRIIRQNLINFDPWIILEAEQLFERYKGLQKRYPSRKLIPFARREDNDDVACWEKENPGKVIIIHDFASIGYEQKEIFSDFWAWFKSMIDDMIEYEP